MSVKISNNSVYNQDVNEPAAEMRAGVVISDPTISQGDANSPDVRKGKIYPSAPDMNPPATVFDPVEIQRQMKKLTDDLLSLSALFTQLDGKVDGFADSFSTSTLSALMGQIESLTGSTATLGEVVSSQMQFNVDGLETSACMITAGTVVYAKTESSHIILVWLSDDFFFCVADSNDWRIDTNGNLINIDGQFEFYFVGNGAQPYLYKGDVQKIIAQGSSVFGQFNYNILGVTTFKNIVVEETANIKTLSVTDKIQGAITEADNATNDEDGNNIKETYAEKTTLEDYATKEELEPLATKEELEDYALKTELTPAGKKLQWDTSSHLYICSTPAATSKKVVTIDDLDITNNLSFKIFLQNGNSANSISVEINGTEYALKIYKSGSKVNVYAGVDAGTIFEVFFDGVDLVSVTNPVVKQTSEYTIYADGTSVYDKSVTYTKTQIDNLTAQNKMFQPFVLANVSTGTATLTKGVWLGISSTAGGHNGVAVFVALVENSTVRSLELVYGYNRSEIYITWSGATVTCKIGSIGLPVKWTNVTNVYWG